MSATMMRLIIDYGNAMPLTGIGIYGRLLFRALRDYAASEVTVGTSGDQFASGSLRPLWRLFYLADLGRQRRRRFNHADVVHFINQYVPKPIPNVRYVVTIHDLDPMLAPDAHTRRFVRYFAASARTAVSRANRVVVPSDTVRQEVLTYLDADPAKVCTAGQGIAPEFTELAARHPKVVPERITLLCVGQLSAKKNVAWLVRVVCEGVVSGALPPMRLVIAGGRGHGYEDIAAALRNAGGLVEWRESPSLAELVALYCSSTAVVLPSLREGFGRPILEAMFCDKPIVASRIPATLELAGDGAEFFSLGDRSEFFEAVRAAVSDRNATTRRAAASRQLERYSWGRLAQHYLSIYRGALDQ